MPQFHFHLRARGTIHRDLDGVELPDLAAAREHALAVTDELMRHSEGGTRSWSMCVEDANGERLFDLYFADVDPRMDPYPPEMRMFAVETCRRHGALIDAMCDLRTTLNETRMLLARARRRPYLLSIRGT
jgi:hypothetical protein